jgi:hypothetical protein
MESIEPLTLDVLEAEYRALRRRTPESPPSAVRAGWIPGQT